MEDFEFSNVKVNYRSTGNSGYWIPSNIKKHFASYHIKDETAKKRKIEDSNAGSSVNKLKMSSLESQQTLQLKIEPDLSQKEVTDSIQASLNAEDALYQQLSTQNIEMTKISIGNNEKVVEFFVQYNLADDSTNSQVKVCRIDPDGNCLFGSIVHQLFHVKIGSSSYLALIEKLRQDVVQYIKTNLDCFIGCLKERVFEQNDKSDDNKDKKKYFKNLNTDGWRKECLKFVDSYLSENHNWGGSETIQAICGECNLNYRNGSIFDKSIAISNRNRNHYDSVVGMNETTMHNFAKKMVQSQNQYSSFIRKHHKQNFQDENEILEIDDQD